MEIHAHSHTPRKKWTHYFWEFLMLFLAVFCGFLAEYQLEHKIEKDREKEYMLSLIEDLKEDTALLAAQLSSFKSQGIDLNSLIFLLNSPDVKKYGADLYYYGRKAHRFSFFNITDRTIQQMKNSGGFRLVRNNFAANAILRYYALMNNVNELQARTEQYAMEYRVFSMNIFNPLVFQKMVDTTDQSIIKLQSNPELLTYDKVTLLKLTSILHYLNSIRTGLQQRYNNVKSEAEKLIMLLKKEYRLE
jgi:hypothetical protein